MAEASIEQESREPSCLNISCVKRLLFFFFSFLVATTAEVILNLRLWGILWSTGKQIQGTEDSCWHGKGGRSYRHSRFSD